MYTSLQNTERILFQQAIDTASNETGLEFISMIEPQINGVRCDASLQIKGYENLTFCVEIKKGVSQTNIGSLVAQLQHRQKLPKKGLLIADYINPRIADKLKNLDVQFMDTVGNIYINEMPLFIFVKGNKTPNRKDSLTFETMQRGRAFQPTGLKVVYALLTNPKLINASYREIASLTHVSLGAVGWVINDLKQGKFLNEYNKLRQLKDIPKLIDKWVDGYLEKLRPKLFVGMFSTDKKDWTRDVSLNITKYNAKFGGETAAKILTANLKPEITTIYLTQDTSNKLMIDNRFRKDSQGNILVFEAFWTIENSQVKKNKSKLNNTVHPLIVYADLLATHNPRNIETARILYDKYLSKIAK
jgi:hypothetical protein